MQLEELIARAQERAMVLGPPNEDEADRLRSDLYTYFGKIPEPPIYRRRDDPVRAQATVIIDEGVGLLARVNRGDSSFGQWRTALELHLKAQCLVADGHLESAEIEWQRAVAVEQRAANERRVWKRSDEVPPRVWERANGQSRFDPRPEPTVSVRLICPSCRAERPYELAQRHATHRFVCASCRATFFAYVGELRQLEVTRVKGVRRYVFRVDELQGGATRVAFEDASDAELLAARHDLVAFLYLPSSTLRGVLNLSSSRVLWVRAGGPCFVATVAFGDGAPELDAFRRFRDRVLLPWAPWVVDAYYARGPGWAQWLSRRPAMKRAVRAALRVVHRVIA